MKLSTKGEILLDSIIDKKLDNVLLENAYQDYFRKMLQKYGVKSPFQLDPATRKKFFNELKAGWAKEKAKMNK